MKTDADTRRRVALLGGLAAALALAIGAFGTSPKASSNVRVPSDGAEILEALAASGTEEPRRREIEGLRRVLDRDPRDVRAATRLARIDIELARERADPRYLGRAQAVLAPWWNEAAPPAVLVLRATIEQSLHDFESALRHLDLALAATPDDVQAWLTRAVVLTVRARYDDARSSCARVERLGARLPAAVCSTQIDSLTGHAREASAVLLATLDAQRRERALSPDEEEWAIPSLGEYAARSGETARAEQHYRAALALSPDDAYVRGALADLLLDAGRPAEAAGLVRGREADDAMLLRLAIAERRMKAKGAEETTRHLAERFDASRARGDVVHRREEARFWLELRDDPVRGLDLAVANWDVQKEPWDARILIACAARAARPEAAAPVLAWLRTTGLEDPAIARAVAELARLRIRALLSRIAGAVVLALAMLVTLRAEAHKPSDSYLTLAVDGAVVRGRWDIAVRDLAYAIDLDEDGDGKITWREIERRHAEIADYALGHLSVRAGDAPCVLVLDRAGHGIAAHSDGNYAVLRFDARCASAAPELLVDYRLFFDVDAQHRGLLRLEAGASRTHVFSAGSRVARFDRTSSGSARQLGVLVREGCLHIWKGYDHILFLLALLLPSVLRREGGGWVSVPSLRVALLDVLRIVTAFTVAHSITLSLAALGIVTLPSRLVESVIALSVVLAAANNLYPVLRQDRWVAAFLLGLMHGFGFASTLIDLDLPRGNLVLTLFGFNLGVELGQLGIVLVFVPLCFAIRGSSFYRRGMLQAGSATVLVLALVWLVERAFNVKILP